MSIKAVWTVTLVALLSISALHQARCKVPLDPTGIYGSIEHAQSCLTQAWSSAQALMASNPASGPNCLRMAFHDAGTYSKATDAGGANGSILQELNIGGNNDLTDCPVIVMGVIAELTSSGGCVEITVADTVQVCGAAAVALSGGPTCNMLMGRRDATGLDDVNLPLPCDDATTGIDRFAAMGFEDPVSAVVVLSGAHNIGQSRIADKSTCSQGLGDMTANPTTFDGHYYTEVVEGTGLGGWFESDKSLNSQGSATQPLMQQFSDDHKTFLSAWCGAYQEMSLLGVNPSPFLVGDGWSPVAPPTPTPIQPTPTPTPLETPPTMTPSPQDTPTPVVVPTPAPKPPIATPTPTTTPTTPTPAPYAPVPSPDYYDYTTTTPVTPVAVPTPAPTPYDTPTPLAPTPTPYDTPTPLAPTPTLYDTPTPLAPTPTLYDTPTLAPTPTLYDTPTPLAPTPTPYDPPVHVPAPTPYTETPVPKHTVYYNRPPYKTS